MYEYLTGGEEILLSGQRRVVEQAKFTYSPLGKSLEKHIKAIEDHRKERNCFNVMNILKMILILVQMAYHLKNKTKI